MKDILLQIPDKINDKVALYIDDMFVDNLDIYQVDQYRINITSYIKETRDSSILNRFYFVWFSVGLVARSSKYGVKRLIYLGVNELKY